MERGDSKKAFFDQLLSPLFSRRGNPLRGLSIPVKRDPFLMHSNNTWVCLDLDGLTHPSSHIVRCNGTANRGIEGLSLLKGL